MKGFKKTLCVVLALVMMMGLCSFGALAVDTTGTGNVTGAGTSEGHLDKIYSSVTLPVVADNSTTFAYTMDPEGLIAATDGAKHTGATFNQTTSNTGVYFLTGGTAGSTKYVQESAYDASTTYYKFTAVSGTATADDLATYYEASGSDYVKAATFNASTSYFTRATVAAGTGSSETVTDLYKEQTTAGTKEYESKSKALTVENKSSFDISLTVKAEAVQNTAKDIPLVADLSASSVTAAALYLGLVVGTEGAPIYTKVDQTKVTAPVSGTDYYTFTAGTTSYTAKTGLSNGDSVAGLYEKNGDEYEVTTDSTTGGSKTYYEQTVTQDTYTKVTPAITAWVANTEYYTQSTNDAVAITSTAATKTVSLAGKPNNFEVKYSGSAYTYAEVANATGWDSTTFYLKGAVNDKSIASDTTAPSVKVTWTWTQASSGSDSSFTDPTASFTLGGSTTDKVAASGKALVITIDLGDAASFEIKSAKRPSGDNSTDFTANATAKTITGSRSDRDIVIAFKDAGGDEIGTITYNGLKDNGDGGKTANDNATIGTYVAASD